MTLQSLRNKPTLLEEEYKKFDKELSELVNEYGNIVQSDAVFKAIDLVMKISYNDVTLLDANPENEPDLTAKFIFINGVLVALADYIYIDEMPVMFLSFHVASMPNTSIKVHELVKSILDIPVISTNVFYPVNSNNGMVETTILYNDEAVSTYTDRLTETLYDAKIKKDKALKLLSKLDKSEMH